MLSHALRCLGLRLGLGLELEQGVHHVPANARHHVEKEFVAFALVFDQGIFLAVAAQTDGFPQGIHLLQVVAPEAVDLLQNEETLGFSHQAGLDLIHLGLFDVVGDTGLFVEEGSDFTHGEIFQLFWGQVRQQVDKLLDLVHHFRQLPFFGGQFRVDVGLHDVVHGLLGIANDHYP